MSVFSYLSLWSDAIESNKKRLQAQPLSFFDSLTKRDRSGYRMHECVVVAVLVYSRVAIAHKKAHKKKTGKSLFSTL